jgi:hypothetical protein
LFQPCFHFFWYPHREHFLPRNKDNTCMTGHIQAGAKA